MFSTIHLDFESASLLNLEEVGLDRYVRHESTRVLMLAWALGDDEVELWQPHLEPEMPAKLKKLLAKDTLVKSAWNAAFERNILSHVLKMDIPIDQWEDPASWARNLSLPGNLEDAGDVLGIGDKAKISDGKRLIRKFCEPASLGGEVTLFGVEPPYFRDWNSDPQDWQLFCNYCKQDVVAEREMMRLMAPSPLPEAEQFVWQLDLKINERGIPTNRLFAERTLMLAQTKTDILKKSLKEKTGLENPNSTTQILKWLKEQGYEYDSVGKTRVASAIGDTSSPLTDLAREVLVIRQQTSKSGYKKLVKLATQISDDDHLRHQFVFMGASRTARWSGYGVQPQNLPRTVKAVEKNITRAMELAMSANDDFSESDRTATLAAIEKIEKEFPDKDKKPQLVAFCNSLIRSAFQAKDGDVFNVCDLSAIENRVLGWLADCPGINKVFELGLDPYLSFAADAMYHVPYDSIVKIENGKHKPKDAAAEEMRQISKAPVLGCGFGLGSGVNRIDNGDGTFRYEAIIGEDDFGNKVFKGLMAYAHNMGIELTPEQAWHAHNAFKLAYPEVTDYKTGLWARMEKAAVHTIKTGENIKVNFVRFNKIQLENGMSILRMKLPSGRHIHYINARVETETLVSKRTGSPYQKDSIYYDGFGHGVGKFATGYGKVYSYGGKLVENAVQAISRDILVHAMMLVDGMGGDIFLHVHDEIATAGRLNDPFGFSFSDLKWCMTQVPEWSPGLLLGAEGYVGGFYKKG